MCKVSLVQNKENPTMHKLLKVGAEVDEVFLPFNGKKMSKGIYCIISNNIPANLSNNYL